MPSPYLRHLLLSRSEWMEARLYANAEANGYGDITPGMSRLFATLGHRSVPLTELSQRLAISRQAVHKMALEGVRLGYVELIDSPTDARAKLLRFTAKGQAMAASARAELEVIETELTARLGASAMQALKDLLGRPWTAADVARQAAQSIAD